MPEQSEWIVNTTDATFEADVMARSKLGLVVVDFWAEWCAPCRMLGPVLEQLARELNGQFTLVKADTEDNQQMAGEFGVSGIPAVFAVLDGQIVDGFQGALPEAEVRSWLQNLEAATSLLQAKQLGQDDPAAAEATIRGILADSPDNAAASLALAELLLAQDRDDECGKLIETLEARGFLEPEAEHMKAELALKSRSGLDIDDARSAAAANPDDLGLQLALAEALLGQQQYAEAFDVCLQLVERDRQQTGEQARALMVEVFHALPADSELVNEYRRKLSMLLF
jgi:putative thioredoxin